MERRRLIHYSLRRIDISSIPSAPYESLGDVNCLLAISCFLSLRFPVAKVVRQGRQDKEPRKNFKIVLTGLALTVHPPWRGNGSRQVKMKIRR